MAEVSLKNINKSYGHTKILHDVSLEVKDGEFVVIVGPSGCGKSTLLRIVAGLEETSEGEIYIGDKKVNHIAPKNRSIAMVFQNYALYPHMTIYDNMAFGLKMKKVPADKIYDRVMHAANILGIEDYLKRRPKELSGGQRQRVAVGRAIVRDPSVFLFDEPLSNLDAKLRVQMRNEIKKLHQSLKSTMIYVTHDQVEAMTMGDRIIVMKDGYLMQSAAPLEIYRRPANRFVAGFIGSPSMNFFKVTVDSNYDLIFKGKRFKIEYSESKIPNLKNYAGQEIILGIRPEHLRIEPEGNGLEVEIELSELMGSESYLHAKMGDTELVARVSAEESLISGVNVHLQPVMGKLHLFEIESGNRIN
ncbi:MAG: sn-glycerol-3-phosphate ABC transporter ATP-binding protein UgpC [Candidatus Marinimicrobia bacterium]|nr:sn-glycerol-3-phosphate ABC transporter ATP-binding protein UgpC [Candidatus Neomarinimicrobiota bacterium]